MIGIRERITGLSAALAIVAASVASVHAQQVFSGDPVDPVGMLPYPMLPGLPLLLPGPDEDFGTADDIIDTGLTGDVDLAVRVGTIVGASVPPPTGAPGGPTPVTITAGGGSTGVGTEVDFSVLVSDGSGVPPYGNVVTNTDLDARPLAIYAFADLDGDGVIGPTDSDGAGDDALERQEATAYVGRQVGSFAAGRHFGSLGVHVAAPASIGGLTISLSAGGYTGSDVQSLYTDGPPIHTLWPYFPPLDPSRVIGNGNTPPPDPDVPSEIEFSPERNYLPAPGHALLGTPFAMPTDGSEPSTDQFISVSGPAHTVRAFDEVEAATFRSVARVWLRPAPSTGGGGRVLVLALERATLLADGAATQANVRLLPIDMLGNVADPDGGGVSVELFASPGVRIVSPDIDADTSTETLTLTTAAGATITLDDDGAPGTSRIDMLSGSRILATLPVEILAGAADTDADGIDEDGNASQLEGDLPCNAADLAASVPCDDNCSGIVNPSQGDDNENGLGDCCDGTCVADPLEPGCDECTVAGGPGPSGAFTKLRIALRLGQGKPDKLTIRGKFELSAAAVVDPTSEDVSVAVLQNDVVQYSALLSGAFEPSGSGTRYRYKDPDGTVAGTEKATIKASPGGASKISWRARGMNLAALDVTPATLDVALGDDAFTGSRACVVKPKRIVCK